MELTEEEMKGKILDKLLRKGKIEHSHTDIVNLYKGFPGHLKGRAKDMIKELVREGILILKPTHYGQHVSINLEKSKEVIRLIEEFKRKIY